MRSLALGAALLLPLAAQDAGITRQQADQILEELRQIRQLLERQAKAPAPAAPQEPQVIKAKLTLDGGHMMGNKDAPVTIVEFTDYQCPFCQRFHLVTFGEIKKNYIDTGKVRFFSKDMPLEFHSNAFRAAEAARCAGDQGRFWEMRDVLGSNPSKLSMEDILGYAKDLKLDVNALRACVDSGKHKAAIQKDFQTASTIGINGTPSFVIGKTTPEGVDGEVVVGAMPYGLFDEKLQNLLK
jgi:protein-disulfide isomerase